ncbi:MAG: class I SAM-dependent methyltransferase [Bacteroidetes bacterium]|nr:class I SAM-dependent methyltransferase [Bacteroidota bacterium]
MTFRIKVRRKIKQYFFRLKLHKLIQPFAEGMLTLAYYSKFSQWCSEQGKNFLYKDLEIGTERRFGLYQFVFDHLHLDTAIQYLEFGVFKGESIRWWVETNKNPDSRFTGFDTFTGLPEDWNFRYEKGHFSTEGKTPDIRDSRCAFVAGLFQDTLQDYVNKTTLDKKTIVHLDADLYSSTLFVLTTLITKLKKGDVLIFDEFSVAKSEFRAFMDVVQSYNVKYKVIGAVNNYHQVAFEIA